MHLHLGNIKCTHKLRLTKQIKGSIYILYNGAQMYLRRLLLVACYLSTYEIWPKFCYLGIYLCNDLSLSPVNIDRSIDRRKNHFKSPLGTCIRCTMHKLEISQRWTRPGPCRSNTLDPAPAQWISPEF